MRVFNKPTSQTSVYPPEISVAEAATKRDSGAFILDVREPDEWNQFHVSGSTLIPLGELASRAGNSLRTRKWWWFVVLVIEAPKAAIFCAAQVSQR